MTTQDIALMGHLMRRAGFGATHDELVEHAAHGYDTTVDRLLDPTEEDGIQQDMIRRYHPDHSGGLGRAGMNAYWLHRMVHSWTPLREKVGLFWHHVFATGYGKLTQGRVLMDQVEMFRQHGLGSLKTLLVELSRDPSMIIWLDNQDNHKGAINENYGRELLELFSMGVGNYSENDIKACARAFTGWTVSNARYMKMKAENDSLWPYGRLNLHFEFDEDDHDNGEMTFLNETGSFNGDDVVDIICRQPATASFISRHMYNFFVADEPPVPQWPYMEPRDPEAIQVLSNAYFESGYNVAEMLRVLFKSDFFKSQDVRYEKVKSPAELVAGVLRLTGEYRKLSPKLQKDAGLISVMGQELLNPPSVEGWHTGVEWVDTGNLVERINFAAGKLADVGKPGIEEMVVRLAADSGGVVSPEQLVDGCLEQMGALSLSETSRAALLKQASEGGELRIETGNGGRSEDKVAEMLRMVAATPDFQRC